MHCVKCTFLLLTSFLLIIGLAPVVLIVWFIVVKTKSTNRITGSQNADIMLSGVVATMAITPCSGFIGAVSKKSCFLYVFATLLIILIIVKIGALTLLFQYGELVERFIEDEWEKFSQVVKDEVQTQLLCCDRLNVTSAEPPNTTPLPKNNTNCVSTFSNETAQLCTNLIYENLDGNKINVAASFGALALIEVIAISLAYIVNQERSRKPKRRRTKVHPLVNLQKKTSSNLPGICNTDVDAQRPGQNSTSRNWAKQVKRT